LAGVLGRFASAHFAAFLRDLGWDAFGKGATSRTEEDTTAQLERELEI